MGSNFDTLVETLIPRKQKVGQFNSVANKRVTTDYNS